jgi:hypothetical protein
MVTMSEALRPDQGVPEIDQERDRQDELENVGEAHTRSSHATNANAAAKNTTVRAIISTSSMSALLLP